MTKVEITALAERWQAKADRAMGRYQESGLARHNREREQAEDLAEALRIAANVTDDHDELISLRGAVYCLAVKAHTAVEEMAELTKALCKVKRATPGATTTAAIANVIEEIADVQIMLDQLRLIFARSTDEVEEEKLRRLLGRLNSYAESNLHDWLNKQPEPGIWCRTVDAGAQPREGGAPDE